MPTQNYSEYFDTPPSEYVFPDVPMSGGVERPNPYGNFEYVPTPQTEAQVAPVTEDGHSEFVKGIFRGMDNLEALGAGAVGLLGDAIGMDMLRDWGYDEYREQIAEAAQYSSEVASYKDIDSPTAFLSYVMGTLGELTPSIAQALLTGGVAGFAGKKMAQKAISEGIKKGIAQGLSRTEAAKLAMRQFGKTLTYQTATKTLPALAVVAPTAAQEAGGMWAEDAETYGLGNVPRSRLLQAAALGGVSGSLELFGIESAILRGNVLSRVFGREIAEETQQRLAKRMASALVKNAVGEGSTEATQELLSSFHKEGLNISEDSLNNIMESFVAGAVGGSAFGSLSGALGAPTTENVKDTQPFQNLASQLAQEYDNEKITGSKTQSFEDAVDETTKELASAQAVLAGEDKTFENEYKLQEQQVRQAHAAGQLDPATAAVQLTNLQELKTDAFKAAQKDAQKTVSTAKARLEELEANHRHFSGAKARSRIGWENTQIQHIDATRKYLAQQANNPELNDAQRLIARQDLSEFSAKVEPLIKRVKEIPDLLRAAVVNEVATSIAQVAPVPVIERRTRDERLRNTARRAQIEQQTAERKARTERRRRTQESLLARRAVLEEQELARQQRFNRGLEVSAYQEDAADYAQYQREQREAQQAAQRREFVAAPYRERSARRAALREGRRQAAQMQAQEQAGLRVEPTEAQFGGYAPYTDTLQTPLEATRMAPNELSGPQVGEVITEAPAPIRTRKYGPAKIAKPALLPAKIKSEPVLSAKRKSQMKSQPKKGKTVKQVSSWIENSLSRLPQLKSQVEVVRNGSDERIPEHLRSEMKNIKAAFVQSTGKIYLFADNLSDKRDAVRALVHEGVAHYGLRAIFSVGQLKKFLQVVYQSKKNTTEFKKLILDDSRYSGLSELEQAEEYVARLAERQSLGHHLNQSEKGILNKVKELIRKALKRISKLYKISDKEINSVISASVFNLAKEYGGRGYRKEWTSLKDIRDVRASSIGEALARDQKKKDKSMMKEVYDMYKKTFYESTDSEGNVRSETPLDRLGAGLQDSTRRVKVIQRHVTDNKGTVSAKEDVYQHEELSHNQIKTDRRKFDEKFISGDDGLLNLIARSADSKDSTDVAYDKVSLLAYAMHAPERNKQIGIRSSTLPLEKITSILGKKQVEARFETKDLYEISSSAARMLAATEGKISAEMIKNLSEKFSIGLAKAETLLSTAKVGANYKGSGWSNSEAAKVISELNSPARMLAVNKLHDINDYRLNLMVEHGLIKPEMAREWKETYQMYVPLKDWDALTSEILPAHLLSEETKARQEEAIKAKKYGKGGRKGTTGVGSWKAAERALGRDTTAADPISATIAQVHDTIAVVHRNEVGKTLLNLVEANPQFEQLWELEKDAAPQYKKYFNKQTGGIDIRPASSKFAGMQDQVVTVLVKGEPTRILLKDESMARALKGADIGIAHPFLRMLGRGIRFLSQTMTTWNPAFWPTNAVRDLATAALNLSDVKLSEGLQGKLKRNLLKDYMKSRRAVYDAVLGRDSKSEYGQWFKLYEEYGGFTEMYGIKDMEGIKKDLKKEVKLLGAKGVMGDTRRFARKAGNALEAFSTSFENATRLIAFKNTAELLMTEKGLSKEDAYRKAASIALNLTVNFTKRGNWTSYLSPLYLFFNAAMQSNARLIKTLANNKAILPALVTGSLVWGMLMREIGGEDEDGNSYYDMIPEYEKDTNLIIMFPGGDYAKLPLPYGFNTIWVAGQAIQEVISKSLESETEARDFSSVISRTMGAMFDNFVPLGSNTEGIGIFIPSLVRPLYQIQMNENYFGKPIYPEESYRNRGEFPDSERYWSNVNPMLLEFSRFLNKYSFGDKYKKGLVDVSPETLEHLLTSYMGGVGQTASRLGNLLVSGISGADDKGLRDIPILRRFAGTVETGYALNEQYTKIRSRVDAAKYTLQDARKLGEDTQGVQKEYRKELALEGRVKATEGRLRAIYKAQRSLRDAYYKYHSISYAEYTKRKEELDKRKETAIRMTLKAAARLGLK